MPTPCGSTETQKGPSRTRVVGREKRTLHRLRRSTGAFLGGMSNQSPGEPLPSSALPLSSSRCRTCGVGEGVMLPPDRWRRAVNRQRSEGIKWERDLKNKKRAEKQWEVEALSLYLSGRIRSPTRRSTEGDFRPLPRLLFSVVYFTWICLFSWFPPPRCRWLAGEGEESEVETAAVSPTSASSSLPTNRGAHYVMPINRLERLVMDSPHYICLI